jgi:hypothetical protein
VEVECVLVVVRCVVCGNCLQYLLEKRPKRQRGQLRRRRGRRARVPPCRLLRTQRHRRDLDPFWAVAHWPGGPYLGEGGREGGREGEIVGEIVGEWVSGRASKCQRGVCRVTVGDDRTVTGI